MNVVGFFLAGSGRKGCPLVVTLGVIFCEVAPLRLMRMGEMRKNKVVVLDSKGYDQYYILPGGAALGVENDGLDDKLVGASKGKLKTILREVQQGTHSESSASQQICWHGSVKKVLTNFVKYAKIR